MVLSTSKVVELLQNLKKIIRIISITWKLELFKSGQISLKLSDFGVWPTIRYARSSTFQRTLNQLCYIGKLVRSNFYKLGETSKRGIEEFTTLFPGARHRIKPTRFSALSIVLILSIKWEDLRTLLIRRFNDVTVSLKYLQFSVCVLQNVLTSNSAKQGLSVSQMISSFSRLSAALKYL